MECKICKKKYKTQKTHDTHVLKYHTKPHDMTKIEPLGENDCCKNERSDVFTHVLKYHTKPQVAKMYDIPKNILCLALKFLEPHELLKCYNAGLDLFSSDYNYMWEENVKQIQLQLKRNLSFVSYGLTYLKYTNSLCFDCLQKSKISVFYDIPLCFKCQKNNYPMMTKTTVMKEYKITNKELAKIQYISTKNPYYKSSYEMQLYLKSDIDKFVKKEVDLQKKLDNSTKKQERIQKTIDKENLKKYTCYANSKMSYDRYINICRRHKELAEQLYKKYSLKIRNDSKLCTNYILGDFELEHDLNKIIDIVAETHWLYNYTDYCSRIDKLIEEDMTYRGRYDYYEIEHCVRNDFRKNAPKVYPWLVSKVKS